jgi:hypothetical protein
MATRRPRAGCFEKYEKSGRQERDAEMKTSTSRGGMTRGGVSRRRFLASTAAGAAAVVLGRNLAGAIVAKAADGEDGFRDLFGEKGLSGWMSPAGGEPGKGWTLADGVLSLKGKGDNLWTKDRFGDFVLDLEFKTTGNSGVLFRCDNPKDYVQTGMEMQVINYSKAGDMHSAGAMYDLLGPTKDALKPNDWNRIVLTCKDNKITVALNGEQIIDMDADKWTEAGKNPDGSKNKFKKPIAKFKREGHVGLQDHGAAVMYRNVKIKPLTRKA